MIVLITDPSKSDDELARIAREACRAVPTGKLAVLLRDKSRDDSGVRALATSLRKITKDSGQRFVLHRDHARLASEVAADEITYLPAHTDDDVTRAIEESIDWLLVSPIFATPGKGAPRGLDAIRNAAKIKANHETPRIFALGGIDASNAKSCIEAGATGVAVIRAILDAPDPFKASLLLWNEIRSS